MIYKSEKLEKILKDNEFYKIFRKNYPNLPMLSNKEYLSEKEKFFQGDLEAQEKIKLLTLNFVGEALVRIFINEDEVNYDFQEAVNDTFLKVSKSIEKALEKDCVSKFRSYIYLTTYHKFLYAVNLDENRKWDISQLNKLGFEIINPDSRNEVLVQEMFDDPETSAIKSERKTRIQKNLKRILTPREFQIVEAYFGLNGQTSAGLLKVSDLYKISYSRTRAIKANAVNKLRADKKFINEMRNYYEMT